MDPTFEHEHGSSNSATAKKSNSAAYEMIPLEATFEPTSLDVICARGKEAYNHPGNIRFRALVAGQLNNYRSASSKMAKSQIVKDIIEGVRQASPKGGFVKKVNGKWFDVGERARREKTGQQIRDLLHESYKSSTKSKALTRKRIRKSHSTNTEVNRDTIRSAAQGMFYTPAGGAPFQRSGSGLPPKLVSLESQTGDAAEMSQDQFQHLQEQHHRRSSDASIQMPQLRRASAPQFSSGGAHSEQDMNPGMGGMMSMSMGNVAMGGGMNMGMDPGMNSGVSSSMMAAHPNMVSTMGINSTAANMNSNMGMNSGMNMSHMNVIGDMNQSSSNMNVVGNMNHPSMQSSGDWGFGQQHTQVQQDTTLLQQQQQLLQLQQQQERLQEQQRHLAELIQLRRSGVPPTQPQQSHAFSGSSQQCAPSYGSNASSQFDVNVSVSNRGMGHFTNSSMTVNVNNSRSSGYASHHNSRPQCLEMLERVHPMLLPANSEDIFADPIPADDDGDESEVSFEEAIDSICQVDEPRKKQRSSRR